MPSIAPAGGDLAAGPSDIDFAFGNAWLLMSFGGNPASRAPFEAAGIRFGWLGRVLPTGQWDPVVDVAAHESATNPAGGPIDSNPHRFQVLSNRAVIADAGANALLQVGLNGAVSTLAVFPSRTLPNGPTIESVPTTVAAAPDGSLFVGELTGQPFPVGAARVYFVPAGGGTPVPVGRRVHHHHRHRHRARRRWIRPRT